jgi:transketolase
MKLVTKPFYDALIAHGQMNPKLFVVTNDLTASCEADGFRDAFPHRYLSAGMAEQALVAALAGLAQEGYQPLYPSFAVFTTRRPYEQVALTVAYPARPVRFFGFLPGLTTPGGVTHQATDDIGLMSQLPNMTVIDAADATDMRTILPAIETIPGPVYVRALRGEVPVLFEEPLQVGKARRISHGANGDEVLVLVTGHPTAMAIAVVEDMRSQYPNLGLMCVNTLKPFDDQELLSAINHAGTVITLENHLLASGMGSIVARHIASNGGPRLISLGINDTFTHGGSVNYLYGFYGLDDHALINAVRRAFGDDVKDSTSGQVIVDEPSLTAAVAEGL